MEAIKKNPEVNLVCVGKEKKYKKEIKSFIFFISARIYGYLPEKLQAERNNSSLRLSFFFSESPVISSNGRDI